MQISKRFVLTFGSLWLAACAPQGTTVTKTAGEARCQGGSERCAEHAHGRGGSAHVGHDMKANCPMNVPGTLTQAMDVEGGIAMGFTTTGDVPELRRRVRAMAERHDEHHAHGGMMRGPGGTDSARSGMMGHGMMGHGGGSTMGHGMMGHGGGSMMGHGMMGHGGGSMGHGRMGSAGAGMMSGGMMPPASVARAEDTEGGARLVLTPKDPADLEKLREHVRKHAAKMASGHCPMMHDAGHQPGNH
jgi:hypothetical protein